LAKFYNFASYFGWSPRDKVFQLKHSLEGAAALVISEVPTECTLEELLSALKLRFGTQHHSERYRAELKARRRHAGEPLQELYQDLCRLKLLVFGNGSSNEFTDTYLRDIFVDALDNLELRRTVLLQEPRTMEAALNIASRIEAIDISGTLGSAIMGREEQKDRGNLHNENRSKQFASSVDGYGHDLRMKKQLAEMRGALNNMREELATGTRQKSRPPQSRNSASYLESLETFAGSSRPASLVHPVENSTAPEFSLKTLGDRDQQYKSAGVINRACFTCGSTQHLARECPRNIGNRDRRPTNDTRKDHTSNKLHALLPPEDVIRNPFLELQLRTHKIAALLDTGCDHSVCGHNIVPHTKLGKTRQKLFSATGEPVPLLGETTIHFRVNGQWLSAKVVVSKAITGIILGIDWLRKNQCHWNFAEGTFLVQGQPGKLVDRKSTDTCRNLTVGHSVTIPA
jgi:hypothetical protein